MTTAPPFRLGFLTVDTLSGGRVEIGAGPQEYAPFDADFASERELTTAGPGRGDPRARADRHRDRAGARVAAPGHGTGGGLR